MKRSALFLMLLLGSFSSAMAEEKSLPQLTLPHGIKLEPQYNLKQRIQPFPLNPDLITRSLSEELKRKTMWYYVLVDLAMSGARNGRTILTGGFGSMYCADLREATIDALSDLLIRTVKDEGCRCLRSGACTEGVSTRSSSDASLCYFADWELGSCKNPFDQWTSSLIFASSGPIEGTEILDTDGDGNLAEETPAPWRMERPFCVSSLRYLRDQVAACRD